MTEKPRSTPTMHGNILIEAFGSIVSEDTRKADISLEDAAALGLKRIDSIIGLDDVDTIITGMNADFTYALQDALDTLDFDVEVDPFYPDVNSIQEDDDIDYQQAWQQGYTWRNNAVFVEDDDNDQQQLVDAAIRLGDAGNNGVAMLEQARRKGVPAIDVNLDDLVDKDAAYGGGESSADAEAAA